MTWAFRHGWGFDARVWAPLCTALGAPPATDERGYFGPAHPDGMSAAPFVLVGHSLGSLHMVAQAGPGCRAMIAINGFDRFTAAPGYPGVPARIVDAMLRRCAGDPSGTVRDFRARCGEDRPPPAAPTPRLSEDLRLLRDADLRDRAAALGIPLLSLHGRHDPILGDAHRHAGFASVPRRQAEEHADGGHLLPLSHPRWCADRILAFLATLA